MKINITEEDLLFNKDLNVCYDELITKRQNFSNNLDTATTLLIKLLDIAIRLENDKDTNGLSDIITGYIAIVKENVSAFRGFKNDIIKSNITKENLTENDRLSLIKMLSDVEFLKFKLDEVIKKIPEIIQHNITDLDKGTLNEINNNLVTFKNNLK